MLLELREPLALGLAMSGKRQSRTEQSLEVEDELAVKGGLRRVTVRELTIERRRRRGKFVYVTPGGRLISDRSTVARLNRLAVPPAYVHARYCADMCRPGWSMRSSREYCGTRNTAHRARKRCCAGSSRIATLPPRLAKIDS
jgi:hypothetical protein